MLTLRVRAGIAAAAVAVFVPALAAHAQGVTTGAITGTVTDSAGQPIEAAQIQLRNPATGFNVGAISRATGIFLIQGVEPNSSYEITVRLIGYAPITRTGIRVTLGQTRREDFRLGRQAAQLSGVTVTAAADNATINPTKTGTGTTISDSVLLRAPTLNRNFTDFVQLVPQVSTTTGYLSGGGVNIRQNSIQIDGAQAGDQFGLGTTGQPGSQANAKSIPLDAVKEYQVLLSPFDIRQGNFGGLLINAITKSGTNDFHGSLYGYTRNKDLTRKQDYLADFSQQNIGVAAGGPIVKNKVFFFVNAEGQRYKTPSTGPYLGSSNPASPVAQTSIDSLNNILSTRYGFSGAGGGERVDRKNPLTNVFARLDANLPFSTRLVLRHNYASADNTTFSRANPATSAQPNFNLTSNEYQFSNTTRSTVAELLTNAKNGMYNELLFNYTTISDFRTVPVTFPQLTVQGITRSDVAATTAANAARFVVGTEASSQGNTLDQRNIEITDNFTVPIASHAITFGAKALFYRPINLFAQNSLGSWTFANLTSLANGVASSYSVSAPSPTDPAAGLATFHANNYVGYVQDVWTVTPTFNLTLGVRYEKPDFRDTPPTNADVLAVYGRNTADVPTKGQFSPRLGFNWDVTGNQRNQLRGGFGYFTGSVPFVYLSNAFGNSGLSGYAALTCNGNTSGPTSLAVPAFNAATIASPPTSCIAAAGKPAATTALGSAINTTDPNFKFPQYQKGTLAYDRRIGRTLVATVEGLYTRAAHNVFYQNLALDYSKVTTGPNGRTMYGALTATGDAPFYKSTRTTVLDATNSQGDYTYSITGQLQKDFSNGFLGSLAYSYQQSKDVTSTTSSTAGSNYRYQRSVSGDILSQDLSKSKSQQPHRIVANANYTFKTKTNVSVIYTGNSGAPFDFVYGSLSGSLGDLNGDGQTQNDLIYVPNDATNQSEILFQGYNGTPAAQATALQQAQAFNTYINSIDCLKNSRGRIMSRNACHNPWINEIDLTIGQSLPTIRMQNVQVRLDIINFANLLNKDWGRQAFSDQGATCGQICSSTTLLTHVANVLPTGVTTSSTDARGVYTFNTAYASYNSNNAGSNYRMQLSLRYSF